jgi:prepilin-type processing-associated H-X9-DG protein/prepilin-type N-terminal cleavage/methylation domain-containing protein
MKIPLFNLQDDHAGEAAFTLVELLAVLAVIAILLVVVVPFIGEVRERARDTQCLSNMRQVAMGMNMYANDNHGYYPAVYPANNSTWRMKLLPYLDMPDGSLGAAPLPIDAGVLTCPCFEKDPDDPAQARLASYVINGWMRSEYSPSWAYRRSAVLPESTLLLLEYNRNTEQFLYAWGDQDVARRHAGNSANYAFVDGHVENIKEKIPRGDKRWYSSN